MSKISSKKCQLFFACGANKYSTLMEDKSISKVDVFYILCVGGGFPQRFEVIEKFVLMIGPKEKVFFI